MGRKSILHYVNRGKFAKVASLLHPGCHQGPNRTALNRYPENFAAAAAAAPDARRILSCERRSSAPKSTRWSCSRP
jgi:hypothetical protein